MLNPNDMKCEENGDGQVIFLTCKSLPNLEQKQRWGNQFGARSLDALWV